MRRVLLVCVAAIGFSSAPTASAQARETAVVDAEEAGAEEESRAPELKLLVDGVWLHKSWKRIEPWGLILSHGLVVDTGGSLVLVDSAWTDAQTEILLDVIQSKFGRLPDQAILTHAHDDKMGGVGALNRAGVLTIAHAFSNADAPARGLTPATISIPSMVEFASLRVGAGENAARPIEIFYPGPGHTRDNIVVHIANVGVLFGGCLIQPRGARSLGNAADGDIANWGHAVGRVKARFPQATIIVPSHGAPASAKLLDATIALADEATANAADTSNDD